MSEIDFLKTLGFKIGEKKNFRTKRIINDHDCIWDPDLNVWNFGDGSKDYVVTCPNCGCWCEGKTKDEAIDKWNNMWPTRKIKS